MSVWYNDIEPFACDVIRANIERGRLPAGTIDERSIADIRAADVRGHAQCHFFAGIGGMAYGLRLAGWPDDLSVWTGGFPCQDVLVAGRGAGLTGARSGLWFEWLRLIDECRPDRLLIENVPALRTRGADDVLAALDLQGYAAWPLVAGAWAVGAPHRRERIWILADRCKDRRPGRGVDYAGRIETCPRQQRQTAASFSERGNMEHWLIATQLDCYRESPAPDDSGTNDGIPGWMDRIASLGNAVVPQCVAAVARAWLRVMESK